MIERAGASGRLGQGGGVQRGRAVLALERAAWLVALFLAVSLPYELRQPWLRLGPLGFTNVELVLAVALALWGSAAVLDRRVKARPPSRLGPGVAAALWLALALMSALAAPAFRAEALKFTGRLMAGALAGWLVYDLARAPGRVGQLAAALALGGLSVGAVGLAEAAGLGPVRAWLEVFRQNATTVGSLLRVSASLPYANITAMYLELTLPLALAWALTARPLAARWLLSAALGLALAALVLTLSRAALGALLGALALVAGLAFWRRGEAGLRRVLAGALAAAGALALVAGAAALLNPLIANRIQLDEETNWYRATYTAPATLALDPGAAGEFPVTIRNDSQLTWAAAGPHPVVLSYRLHGPSGEAPAVGPRSPLPADLPPGATVDVLAVVVAPDEAGLYTIEWDLVEEGITWFGAKSGVTGVTTLSVGGAMSAADTDAPGPAPAPPRLDRLALWGIALRMAAERPVLGVGPDNFRHLYGAYVGATVWDDTVHANNLYLEWLATLGVPGALAFLWLMWQLVRGSARLWQRGGPPSGLHPAWGLALAASLAAWFAHGLLDYFYPFTATNLAFWLIAGLALRAGRRAA